MLTLNFFRPLLFGYLKVALIFILVIAALTLIARFIRRGTGRLFWYIKNQLKNRHNNRDI